MKQIEIKIQRGLRKRIKSDLWGFLTVSSELVIHIVIDSYSWPSQYLSGRFPGLRQGYLGSSVFYLLCVSASFLPAALPPVCPGFRKEAEGTGVPTPCPDVMLSRNTLSVWTRGEFVSLATYRPPSHPSVKRQSWLLELGLCSKLSAALSESVLLAATAPARARWSRERKEGPKKREREKEESFPQKRFIENKQFSKSYFFIS